MAAGNASNTVFTAIPVGEDFYMSFSTERFHETIAPQDFLFTGFVFKLYDARLIGNINSPNPNAVILTYSDQNPTVLSNNIKILDKAIAVFVSAAALTAYEQTRTGNSSAVFRGELYGFLEAVVTGEETKFARMLVIPTASKLTVRGDLQDSFNTGGFWDGYFFQEDVRPIAMSSNTNSPALGAVNTSS